MSRVGAIGDARALWDIIGDAMYGRSAICARAYNDVITYHVTFLFSGTLTNAQVTRSEPEQCATCLCAFKRDDNPLTEHAARCEGQQ